MPNRHLITTCLFIRAIQCACVCFATAHHVQHDKVMPFAHLLSVFVSAPPSRSYMFNGYYNSGFSVVRASCLDNLTHTRESRTSTGG